MPHWSCSDTAFIHGLLAWKKLAIVCGNAMIEEAKITGMTPLVFTRRGRWVGWPPYMRRPTTRLAYWTVMRRWPRSTNTMAATTATIIATRRRAASRPSSPRRIISTVLIIPRGKPTTMPAKMSRLIPLPIPRSVICSPSHMMNAVPVVRVSTVMSLKAIPGCSTMWNCWLSVIRSRYTAMPSDCTIESITVP